jgi:CheY-like chemotaxis protein
MNNNAKSTILVVDDEPFVQMLLTDFFEELNYATLSAGDAKSALLFLGEERAIDLLLTDVGLPGINGRALAEAARKLRPSLPVLFATGYGDNHRELREKLAPGMAVISKPFDMARLPEIVLTLIRGA